MIGSNRDSFGVLTARNDDFLRLPTAKFTALRSDQKRQDDLLPVTSHLRVRETPINRWHKVFLPYEEGVDKAIYLCIITVFNTICVSNLRYAPARKHARKNACNLTTRAKGRRFHRREHHIPNRSKLHKQIQDYGKGG